MLLYVPSEECYIKSGDSIYRNYDTISITTSNHTSSVLLRIRRTGYGNFITNVSLHDKETRREIITMSSDEFISLVEGSDADYEIMNNEFFLIDGNGNKIEIGKYVVSIYGSVYTVGSIDMDGTRCLEDGNGSEERIVPKCLLALKDKSHQIISCYYTIRHTEFLPNDAYAVYELTDGPTLKLFTPK